MKILTLLALLTSSIFALTIDDSLLKMHATLVPKIYLMDYKFKNKLVNNTITIAIVYKSSEYLSAKSLQKKINNKYEKGIKSYKVSSKLVAYKDIEDSKANIYYLLPTSKETIQKTVSVAKKNHALTFSYLKSDLNYGVMISLNISNKIKPILNLNAIKLNHINLRPILLDISTIFRQSRDSLLDIYNMNSPYSFKSYYV